MVTLEFNGSRRNPKGGKGTKQRRNDRKRGRKTAILRPMAAKKKPEASKRGGVPKSEDVRLTYKKISANLGKTDYSELIDFEKDKGISTPSEALRQLMRLGLRAWRQGLEGKKDSAS